MGDKNPELVQKSCSRVSLVSRLYEHSATDRTRPILSSEESDVHLEGALKDTLNTFASLGIPFPLFEGRAEESSEYAGITSCSLCGRADQHCFQLGIGSAIIVDCPECETQNGLDADDREHGSCRKCEADIAFPEILDEEINICYSCLRSGRAAITKDSPFGMISWEQAFDGITHGMPGEMSSDFEKVPRASGWTGVRVPSEMMFELLRTPGYATWQDMSWQFCCKQPMIFVGTWDREQFSQKAADGNGKAFFEQIVQYPVPGLWEDNLHDVTGVYVFRCGNCSRLSAHWDVA